MSPSDSLRPDDPRRPEGDASMRERLTAYLDGELSPAESCEVLAWLEKNPHALKELEEHRRVWALLGAYKDEPVPPGFAERVLSSAGAFPAASRPAGKASLHLLPGGRALRFAAVAAVVVLAVGVGVVAGPRLVPAPRPDGGASSLDSVPTALLESEAGVNLATVSDEEFETILQGDPEDLAQVVAGRGGGG